MLRVAVVGVGYLGKFHANKYRDLGDCQLVGVVDPDEAVGRAAAEENDTRYFSAHQQLLDDVDAVSIAVPTSAHYSVARDFLKRGVHVLVEKPATATLNEAYELIELAKARKLVLQVGYLERFNQALTGIRQQLCQPRFIESHRLAEFKPRSMDINVVMDLMVHDLDIILDLVRQPVIDIAANGAAVLTDNIDIAQARLTFAGGCVANLTSSRISMKCKRKMHIFQDQSCICVDFNNLTRCCFSKGEEKATSGIPEIHSDQKVFTDRDSLRLEIEDFIDCIQKAKAPRVTGEDGARVLEVATRITSIIDGQQP